MVVEYTPHADDEIRYVAVPYVASNAARAHPLARWWGEGQASAFDDPAVVTFLADRYYRLTFNQETPDEHWAGGDLMGVSAPGSADAPDYDLMTRDSAAEARGDQKTLAFEHAGRYRVKMRLWSSADTLTDVGLFAYEVMSGTDDQFLFAAPGYIAEVRQPFGSADTANVRIGEFNEVLDLEAGAQLTSIFVATTTAGGANDAATERLVSFYAEVERLD